jgi:hypothetical protein
MTPNDPACHFQSLPNPPHIFNNWVCTPEGQEGRLWVTQEEMEIIEQKILSCSPPVKKKFAGRIPLDNSSYDEYYEV